VLACRYCVAPGLRIHGLHGSEVRQQPWPDYLFGRFCWLPSDHDVVITPVSQKWLRTVWRRMRQNDHQMALTPTARALKRYAPLTNPDRRSVAVAKPDTQDRAGAVNRDNCAQS
jgi:hypothetical protein